MLVSDTTTVNEFSLIAKWKYFKFLVVQTFSHWNFLPSFEESSSWMTCSVSLYLYVFLIPMYFPSTDFSSAKKSYYNCVRQVFCFHSTLLPYLISIFTQTYFQDQHCATRDKCVLILLQKSAKKIHDIRAILKRKLNWFVKV